MVTFYLILACILGLMAGALVVYIIFNNRLHQSSLQGTSAVQHAADLNTRLQKADTEFREQNKMLMDAHVRLSSARTETENLKQKLEEQQSALSNLQEKFTVEFKNIANELLEEKSKKFTEQNQTNLNALLNPLSEKIKSFEKKIEDAYDKELRDKISLREEVRKLYELNTRISTEANNLTKALRGDTRKQGNWGELILEKVLEQSGLKKGVEYETQLLTKNQNGETIKPDVVIFLPDNKHVVVDSKVSLTAYDRHVNTEEEEERSRFLREHLNSVRSHVKLLSDKNYYTGDGLRSPDFVLLFLPLESAFSTAVQADHDLFNYAWEKRIVIVSPTTLLATLSTVASLWKIESQNKNAMEIARLSGAMYDKLVGFMEDMIKVGLSLRSMEDQYKAAMNKLHEGSGNVIRTADKVKRLGAKTTKALSPSLVDRAED